MKDMPAATLYLVLRKTAVEAMVIGFLIKDRIDPAWKCAVSNLDYSKLMK